VLGEQPVSGAGDDVNGDTVDERSDEGMLREAADLLRFGVARWNNQNFAWVAADLLDRIDQRFPGSKDVVPRG
jgi:hypothetical protein